MIPEMQMEAYERLRAAVVKSAVEELKQAIRKSKRMGCVCEEQKKAEEWFRSKWGQFLCGEYGEYIINRCRENYKRNTDRRLKE